MSSRHASPFHCPYCGESDALFPHAEGSPTDNSWECRGCLRAFSVTFLGQVARPGVDGNDRQESSR